MEVPIDAARTQAKQNINIFSILTILLYSPSSFIFCLVF
jgi:hypothetical protein